jgi:peptidyl-tRNA hydrolase
LHGVIVAFAAMDDPLRMYIVVRRGAVGELARAGELAGAAAVACVREPAFAAAVAAWRPRPGKVCLRARNTSQWEQVLEEPHAPAGDAVVALPPRRRSERGPLLERLQAMSTELDPPPPEAPRAAGAVTYVLNPEAPMSSGKTLAQIAHAAVMSADSGRLEDWVAAGCPAQVLAPSAAAFRAAGARLDLVARVADAGLTEVAPGTVTVVALPPP